jgi:hypothetical protein
LKNKYKILDEYVEIYSKKKNGDILTILVDVEDFDKVKDFKYSWVAHYQKDVDNYYAIATIYLGMQNDKPKYQTVYMHRFIMGENDNRIDHVDHNTLDNRKHNLRKSTVSENALHRQSINKNNTSGYRNVSWSKNENQWIVQLQINKKNKVLGRFDDVHQAGEFAREMRAKYYKEFRGKG